MIATSEQRAKAAAMIKAVYDDKEAEINGRKYKFTATTHLVRRKIFSFFTSVQSQLESRNFAFLDSAEFAPVETAINKIITYDDMLLDKSPEHWEKYPEDYLQFISVAMGVISYPFLKGNLTG